MTYVWIHETDGSSVMRDDKLMPPCNYCGRLISECRASTCEEDRAEEQANTYCTFCMQLEDYCRCDNITDAIKEMEL